ncbi:acyl-CoA dehydrogenase [Nitriliruptor alkaliphilus]|uniref:acyl-CoA dehydrogenase n=1 Tax=Nitriliruptor alkaliphilus TaxID=427918 RepID=UPI00069618A9|nr:acyl-CoA dehydrogenase [Nitriliruptor alkaliphilus]
MSHYKSNLRDIEFNLYEVLGAGEYFGTGAYEAVDEDQARMLLSELERFASESIWADSFVPADRTPLALSPEGDITIPEELDQALKAFYEAGWHLMPLPTHLGGYGAPPTIRWAGSELLSGSHATAMLWPIGALMASIVDQIGTEGQKQRFARPMIEECWGGTMVLTEPDAGSDVGAGTTRAIHVEDAGEDDLGAIYHLEGVKRFITSADAQTHPNTVHLVLARPEGAAPGTKGLSLFIVPKLHVGADGSLGERNGVRVSNIEKKMGIKGSATCELSLGQDGTPCVGYLVGDVHDGIRQMFLVIEYARMMVGTKAMATLSTGYLNALDYAKIRQQGADMTQMADKTAPKVEIIKHPDVRRMLMEQKAHAEGMRALVMFTGWVQDQAGLTTDDEDAHTAWIAREDLLLPLVKGYCSEKAYELLALSLQTFGGSGFTQDYPVEQYIRDAKIDTLYEGTTAIQALDLLFRKIIRDQGATLTWVADQIRELVKAGGDGDPFAAERERLGQALDDTQGHLGVLIQHAMASMDESSRTEIYKTGLQSTEFLHSLAETIIGWLLLRQAEVAQAALDGGATGADADFYTGKVASARWFSQYSLPKAAFRRQRAADEDGWVMDVPEAAF